MPPITAVTINGLDPQLRFSLAAQRFSNVWDGPAVAETEGRLFGRAGRVIDSDVADIDARDLSIDVIAPRLASADAVPALLDQVKALWYRGDLEIVVQDQPTRAFYGRVRALSLTRSDPQLLSNAVLGTIRVRCLDPYQYDLVPHVIAVPPSGRADLATGTAPSWPLVHLMGAAVDPVLSVLGASGETLASIGFDVDLTASQYLEIDMQAQTIRKVDAGVVTDAYGTVVSGDFFALPATDPSAGASPALRVTGVSTGGVVAYYRRAWL